MVRDTDEGTVLKVKITKDTMMRRLSEDGAKDVVYFRKLVKGLGDSEVDPTPLYTDSQSARAVSYNPGCPTTSTTTK